MRDIIKMFDHDFKIEKNKKLWKVSTVKYYLKVSEGATKKQAIEGAKNIIINQGGKIAMDKALNDHKIKITKNKFFDNKRIQNLFEYIFKIPLISLTDTFLLGFCNIKRIDIVKFDKFLNTPDNASMHEFINKKFGKMAVKLVKKLIK